MIKALFFKHTKEAEDFEKKTGLSGISRNYRLPDNLTPEKLAKCIKSPALCFVFGDTLHNVKLLTHAFRNSTDNKTASVNNWSGLAHVHLLKSIIDLNPELKSVNYFEDNPNEIRRFLWGIASGYNSDDIEYGLETLHNFDCFNAIDPMLDVRHDDINRITGHGAEWMISPNTYDLILNQMDVVSN